MCCLITSLFLFGPRFAALIWWLINPLRFTAAFSSFVWPILGILFMPWTTLMYLIVWSPLTGVYGLDWLWLALAVLADLGTYAGGGYGNRDRIPGYAR
jgi:apolipoprotein N-acyltransferase